MSLVMSSMGLLLIKAPQSTLLGASRVLHPYKAENPFPNLYARPCRFFLYPLPRLREADAGFNSHHSAKCCVLGCNLAH
jgi:hypothetical protein